MVLDEYTVNFKVDGVADAIKKLAAAIKELSNACEGADIFTKSILIEIGKGLIKQG